jgi:hypothetical protein
LAVLPTGLTLKDAVLAPLLVGLKVTETAHCPAGGSCAGQLLTRENWFAFVPLSEIEAIPAAVVPVLETVTVLGELVVPRVTLPNANDVGVTVIAGLALTPVPVSATPLVVAPTLTFNLAVFEPAVVGVKTVVISQLAPIARSPQLF